MDFVFPDFDDCVVPNGPTGSLWGFYDKEGVKDELGSLNLLTPAVVLEASREIQSGRHVQLDWPLESLRNPSFGRRAMKHHIIDSLPTLSEYALDDEIEMNTQTGSHWDSLKHYAWQSQRVFYNGLTYEDAKASNKNGIHNWCRRGGIVGRGILVDMATFYEKHRGTTPDAWSSFAIPPDDLDAALASQNTVPHRGDILLICTGYIKRCNDNRERADSPDSKNEAIGLAPTEATVRWLYKHHFAALAGDSIAFEAWPRDPQNPWALHEWALVHWGTPLGELWDLERLSQMCEEEQRWSFFLTSAPLNADGGIGSLAQAIAIF